jgi:hypothetical protein
MLTITVLPKDGSMPYERRFRNPKNAAKFLESLSGRRPTKRAPDRAKSAVKKSSSVGLLSKGE